jgi:23S rRNA (cytidine1920-2'-O)/16S rRNA (cytidine1409-2'-O)-methyltransferase
MTRSRLDQLLVERGLAESRSKAATLLLAGKVRVGTGDGARRDRKPGDVVDTEIQLAVDLPEPYVSRGGYKLAAALETFEIDPRDLVCLDVGASTGGFTDVLLQRCASRVYALDVGHGQLAQSLRDDPRVVSIERANARHLRPDSLPEQIDLAVVDVSFISLELVLAPVASTLEPDSRGIVALVKPQFEAGRGRAPKGVVRDPAVHREVLEKVVGYAERAELGTRGLIASPIEGADGNREFLVHLVRGQPSAERVASWIDEAVGAPAV